MKKTTLFLPLSILSVSVLLVGCGGGGSSVKSTVSVAPVPTTITTSSPALFDAISNEVDYVAVGSAAINTVDAGVSQTSSANLTYDANGNLTKLVITTPHSTPGSSISWDSSSGDTSSAVSGLSDHIVLNDSGGTYDVLAVNPKTSAFDYQTFGVWRTGKDIASSTGTIGVLSAGLKTPAASVPTTGSATFTGKLLGVYVNANGIGNFVTGSVSINSDFVGRSLAFSTSATQAINPTTGAATAVSSLDMAGTLAYGVGTNAFAGAVSAPGAGLTGTTSGAFYGPGAEEVGGVFNVKAASGVSFYSGSFGAKQ